MELKDYIAPMYEGEELIKRLAVQPAYDDSIRNASVAERLMALSGLYDMYIPTDMTVEIYYKLYLGLVHSLSRKRTSASNIQLYENYKAIKGSSYHGILGGVDSFVITGSSGIGKSSAISRAISVISSDKIIMSADGFYNDNNELRAKETFSDEYSEAIPIGSIQFVSAFLKIFFDIEREYAFEIPNHLRTYDLLKREYRIVDYSSLPQKGNYFVKDVTVQRTFSFIGSMQDFFRTHKADINKEHQFLVSEVLEIYSEYRVYVVRDRIKNISFYKGDPEILPDIEFIRAIISDYSKHKGHLQSYSIDVMVTPRGNAIIEMHTFLSLGLYSTQWDESLLVGYADGLNYILQNTINDNIKNKGELL